MQPSPPIDPGQPVPRPLAAALAVVLVVALGWSALGTQPGSIGPSSEDMAVHLQDAEGRSAWLATWMPGPEIGRETAKGSTRPSAEVSRDPSAAPALGRPLEQIGGPAFWASHLLSAWTSDPATHARWLTWLGLIALAVSAAGLAGGCLGQRRAPLLLRAALGALACGLPLALARMRGDSGPLPADAWALAAGLWGVWSLLCWTRSPADSGLGHANATRQDRETSSLWSHVGFAFALHTVLLAAPARIAQPVVAVLLSGMLLGLFRLRSWRHAMAAGAAVVLAFASVAPVYLDAFRDSRLDHEPPGALLSAGALPLIVPTGLATVDPPGSCSVDLTEALDQSGVAEIEWVLSDQLSLRLPRVREEKLLVLPIRFHPMWRASFRGMIAQPLRVNGLYQGVLVRDRMWEVDVSYVPQSPLVLFSQMIFGCLGLLWLFGRLRLLWLGDRRAERARRVALLEG